MNFTNRIEFTESAINSIREKLKYNCIKKSTVNDKKKMRYFFMERCRCVNIKTSQVNISPENIAVINSVIIKNSLKQHKFCNQNYSLLRINWQEEHINDLKIVVYDRKNKTGIFIL